MFFVLFFIFVFVCISRQFCTHLLGYVQIQIRGLQILSLFLGYRFFFVLSRYAPRVNTEHTVSIFCVLLSFEFLNFTIKRSTVLCCHGRIVILRRRCQCFAFAMENITTFTVTIMCLLLLFVGLFFSVCVKHHAFFRLLPKHHCQISLDEFDGMTVSNTAACISAPELASTSSCVRNASCTKNQPSGKVSCTIFPLNFSLLHIVSDRQQRHSQKKRTETTTI